MMTPRRQRIASDAVTEALRVLYSANDGPLSAADVGRVAEQLGAARAALVDHLWDKQGYSRATSPTPEA